MTAELDKVGRAFGFSSVGRIATPSRSLQLGSSQPILHDMSAGDLIKQVKALPPRERRKFLSAVLALEEEDAARLATNTKPVKWPDVEERAKRIFGNRILPNLALLEREEEDLLTGHIACRCGKIGPRT